jgi:NAD+ kinase
MTMAELQAQYGQAELGEAEVIVALGGDGFMLRTLHRFLPDRRGRLPDEPLSPR